MTTAIGQLRCVTYLGGTQRWLGVLPAISSTDLDGEDAHDGFPVHSTAHVGELVCAFPMSVSTHRPDGKSSLPPPACTPGFSPCRIMPSIHRKSKTNPHRIAIPVGHNRSGTYVGAMQRGRSVIPALSANRFGPGRLA